MCILNTINTLGYLHPLTSPTNSINSPSFFKKLILVTGIPVVPVFTIYHRGAKVKCKQTMMDELLRRFVIHIWLLTLRRSCLSVPIMVAHRMRDQGIPILPWIMLCPWCTHWLDLKDRGGILDAWIGNCVSNLKPSYGAMGFFYTKLLKIKFWLTKF